MSSFLLTRMVKWKPHLPSLTAISLLLCAPALFAQTKVYPSPGKFVGVVRVDSPSKWSAIGIGVDSQGRPTFVPVTPVILDGGKVCLIESGAGSFAVTSWPEGATQPETNIVVLGNGPAPIPPGPIPPPNPPAPDDPLLSTLRAIYGADQTPGKAEIVTAIAKVFRSAGRDVDGNGAFKTVGESVKWLASAMNAVSRPGTLPALKDKLSEEMNAKLPRNPATPLTADVIKTCAAEFNRLAGLLEKLP